MKRLSKNHVTKQSGSFPRSQSYDSGGKVISEPYLEKNSSTEEFDFDQKNLKFGRENRSGGNLSRGNKYSELDQGTVDGEASARRMNPFATKKSIEGIMASTQDSGDPTAANETSRGINILNSTL